MIAHNKILDQNFKSPNRFKSYVGKPIAEIIVNGFFTVDQSWGVKYWNKAAEQLLGIPSENVVNKNLWKQFEKLIPPDFYEIYHQASLTDIPAKFREYWPEMDAWFEVNTWQSEDLLYVSFKSSNQRSPDNAVQRLQTATELYKFVTEITNDCLWEWDLHTDEIFWIDGGHKRVFGYPIENTLVPKSFWKNCIHPDDKVRVLTKLNKAINGKTGCIWEDEYRYKNSSGNYLYVHDRGHIVFDEDNTATRIIGATQDINVRVLLEKELAEQKRLQQIEITGAVLTALENERASIGNELQENLGQMLAVAQMYLQMANKYEEQKETRIDQSISFIQNVINEIRKISKELVIPANHIISLPENIKILVEDITAVNLINIEFHETAFSDHDLKDSLVLTIYRIIQEQINNILKHSNATAASITLSRSEGEIKLEVSDNGIGADLAKESKGVGMINIKSRVELHHGNVILQSQPGKGFKMKAIFSLKENLKPMGKIV